MRSCVSSLVTTFSSTLKVFFYFFKERRLKVLIYFESFFSIQKERRLKVFKEDQVSAIILNIDVC